MQMSQIIHSLEESSNRSMIELNEYIDIIHILMIILKRKSR